MLKLTSNEQKLCKILVDTAQHIIKIKPELPPVSLRVAGGWVRDKILGIPSSDMDIALDTMMGFDFASFLHGYLNSLPELASSSDFGGFGKIKANPEKSKHLETATMRLFDIHVDFVNLRSETYQEGSRIPTITFGSPLEDAQRRDLTINSLFYNLHSGQIEDFLGMGLQDLRKGFIRTPLPPFETFRDDPLRILRAIRFACRFNYRIDPAIPDAIKKPEIRKSLETVVSRERIGEEVKKMFSSSRSLESLKLFIEFGIYDSVFAVPASHCSLKVDSSGAVKALESFDFLLGRSDILSKFLFTSGKELSTHDLFCIRLACALYPHVDSPPVHVKKTHSESMIANIMRSSLKQPNHESEIVASLNSFLPQLNIYIDKPNPPISSEKSFESPIEFQQRRKEIGMFLNLLGSSPLKSKCDLAILYSAIIQISKAPPANVEAIIDNHLLFVKAIHDYNLSNAFEATSPFNGNEVVEISSEALGENVVPGKWVGEAQRILLEYFFEIGFGLSQDELRLKSKLLLLDLLRSNSLQINKRPKAS